MERLQWRRDDKNMERGEGRGFLRRDIELEPVLQLIPFLPSADSHLETPQQLLGHKKIQNVNQKMM